ncbi:MAG: hypothetical protein EOP92_01375 [Lysobacteraceae bacterium]|nr:MAG: hypothetical protein EOP92_01375 [Xanthomonadaceae bacterium]
MKKQIVIPLLLAFLAPAVSVANTAPTSVELPQTVTTTGSKFMARCSDEDFKEASNPRILGIRCQQLLTLWKFEVSARQPEMASTDGGRAHSNLPNPSIPSFNSIRGIPAYPSR